MGSHSEKWVRVTAVEGGRHFCKGLFVKVNLKQALEEERLSSIHRGAVGQWGGWSRERRDKSRHELPVWSRKCKLGF